MQAVCGIFRHNGTWLGSWRLTFAVDKWLQIELTRNYDSSKITPLICGTASTAVAGNTCDVDG